MRRINLFILDPSLIDFSYHEVANDFDHSCPCTTHLGLLTSHKVESPNQVGNSDLELNLRQSHCNAISRSWSKWYPIIRSVFRLLFWGESVRVEFLWFRPDLWIMVYGVNGYLDVYTLFYVNVANPSVWGTKPLSSGREEWEKFYNCLKYIERNCLFECHPNEVKKL